MSAPQLVETDAELILGYLQSNLAQALADVSAARTVKVSNLPKPREWFFYDGVAGYQPPAIFVVPTTMDFRNERGQNFVDALTRVNVTALVEDKDVKTLTLIAWRYQAALFKCLNLRHISNQAESVKVVVKVDRADFSPVYTNAQEKGNPQGAFRMEVMLSCEVEHYEAYP